MNAPDRAPPGDSTEQSFLSHLIELRRRLLAAVTSVLVVLLALMYYSNDLYYWLAKPLLAQMQSTGATMIATEVAAPFLAPFKLTIFVAIFVCVPYIFHQIWAFVAPGLYLHEKRLAFPLLVSSIALFYTGVAFAYFVVFPVMFGFFAAVAPSGVTIMTDISRYLDFVLVLFLAFGVAFEVPIATFLIVRTEIVTVDELAKKRPYIMVGAFVVAAVLTPPDVFSQTLLATPMCLLFEIGLVLCRMFPPPVEEATTPAERPDDPA